MTITIKTGHGGVSNFRSYLDDFNDNFAPVGRGAFSQGIMGDYAASEAAISDVADASAQAYVIRGNIAYDVNTHQISGSVDGVELGQGATATAGARGNDLALEQIDYRISFSAPVTDDDGSSALIYGILGAGDANATAADAVVDRMKGEDIRFVGSAGNDVFAGFANDDTLIGRRGNDVLRGRNGDDELKGGRGRDKLLGGGGNDELNGGTGNDRLTGGKGEDTFVFKGKFDRDVVNDFQSDQDKLDLSMLNGEAASFDEFAAASSEKNGRVVYDMDGDGQNVIVLRGTTLDDLAASDFIF